MLGVQMVPALLYFTLLWFVPESPRWLLLKGKDEAALQVLQQVSGRAAGAGESATDPSAA